MLIPLVPDARPKVGVDLGAVLVDVEASVLPSGAGLLLPREVMGFFAAREQAAADLRIEVSGADKPLVGSSASSMQRLQESSPF